MLMTGCTRLRASYRYRSVQAMRGFSTPLINCVEQQLSGGLLILPLMKMLGVLPGKNSRLAFATITCQLVK